jgi:hypothetical protein
VPTTINWQQPRPVYAADRRTLLGHVRQLPNGQWHATWAQAQYEDVYPRGRQPWRRCTCRSGKPRAGSRPVRLAGLPVPWAWP